ncbi:MAG: cytochrome P450 [Verrucomicrobia bacterium]|nr:cytochrome P450 [Verrucomicrobiota bacterium]
MATSHEGQTLALPHFQDPDYVADPYKFFRLLRENDPVHWVEPQQTWYLTRYADLFEVLRGDRISSARIPAIMSGLTDEQRSQYAPFINAMSSWMLFADPPDHTRLRGLVNKAFTPRVIENLGLRVEHIVKELLDSAQNRGEIDLIADFALPLPSTVISEMLGVPSEDQADFQRWSDDIVEGLNAQPDTLDQAQESLAALSDFFRPIVERLRANPEENLMSALVPAEDEGDKLTSEELFANCVNLLIAGHETTANLTGNGTLALLKHPDQLALLRENPDLIGSAVEELLRYYSPTQNFTRIALEDFEINGKSIREGQRIMMCYGAVNRDPEQFENPDVLDISREMNWHMAFAHGTHYCLGAVLARLEGQIAIGTLIERFPNIRLATDEIEFQHINTALRGLKSLKVSL